MQLTHAMFGTLLTQPECPPLVQQEAYNYANRTSNTDLMVALLRRDDLLPEIDARLGARNELDVLVTWARRTGRTTEEILARFSAEKRATLLLDIAALPDLPEELYRSLAKRRSVTVNWELVANRSVPLDLRISIASVLGAGTTQRNWGVNDKIRPITCVEEDDVYVAFLDNLTNPVAALYLVRSLPAREIPIRRLEAIARACARTVADPEDGYSTQSAWAELLIRDHLSDEDFESLASIAQESIDAAAAEGLSTYVINRLRDDIKLARTRRNVNVEDMLMAISRAVTPVEIDTAVNDYRTACQALRLARDDGAVGTRVTRNSHASAKQIRDHYRHLEVPVAIDIARRAVAERDLEMARTVFEVSTYMGNDLFAVLYRESENPEALLSWALGDDTVSPNWLMRSSIVSADADLALRVLPAGSTMGNSRFAEMIATLLAEKLGDNPKRWETFYGLSTEWTGSFVDLVQSAVALTE